MKQHFRRTASVFFAVASALFLTGFAGSWSFLAGLLCVLLLMPAALLLLVVAGLHLSLRGIRLSRSSEGSRGTRVAAAAVAPVAMLLVVPLIIPLAGAGSYAGAWSQLVVNRYLYREIIELARGDAAGRDPWTRRRHRGITFMVDRGPPLRVAFNPDGLLDSWSAVIFDPSGEVMLADGHDDRGRHRAPPGVAALFGGNLHSCRRLADDYFHCGFD